MIDLYLMYENRFNAFVQVFVLDQKDIKAMENNWNSRKYEMNQQTDDNSTAKLEAIVCSIKYSLVFL